MTSHSGISFPFTERTQLQATIEAMLLDKVHSLVHEDRRRRQLLFGEYGGTNIARRINGKLTNFYVQPEAERLPV